MGNLVTSESNPTSQPSQTSGSDEAREPSSSAGAGTQHEADNSSELDVRDTRSDEHQVSIPRRQQSVDEVLTRLGCGLEEMELWCICHQTVLALKTTLQQLPAYISLVTVAIDEKGYASFLSIPEDKDLELVYLAPELQEHGIVTEKTCLFGVAAMLWSAADYNLPSNQEPALSDEFENLLVSMTQDCAEDRPSIQQVIQICENHRERLNILEPSFVCASLVSEAFKVQSLNEDQKLLQDIADEKLQKDKKLVLKTICEENHMLNLRPVSERILPHKPYIETLHDKLMKGITESVIKLRKTSRPRVSEVKDWYCLDQNLLKDLSKVTFSTKNTPSPSIPSAFTSETTHFTPIIVSSTQQSLSDISNTISSTSRISSASLAREGEWELSGVGPQLTHSSPMSPSSHSPSVPSQYYPAGQPNSLPQPHNPQIPSQQFRPPLPYPQFPPNPQINAFMQQQQQQPHSQNFMNASIQNPYFGYSFPNQAVPPVHPGMANVPSTAALMQGVQMQLQQDPQTGLFSLVPVFIPGVQVPTGASSNIPGFSSTLQSPSTPYLGLSNRHIDSDGAGSSPRTASPSGSKLSDLEVEKIRYLRQQSFDSQHRVKAKLYNEETSKEEKLPRPVKKLRERKSRDRRARSKTLDSIDIDVDKLNSLQQSFMKSNAIEALRKSNSDEHINRLSANSQSSSKTSKHGREKTKNKIKRAKSVSSADRLNAKDTIDANFFAEEQSRAMRRNRPADYSHRMSPLHDFSPPLSPSWSKDSGVSGLNPKHTGDSSLMDRLLNSDSIRQQQKLSRLIDYIREEFAYESYMENGVEDLAIAEYILSLANLKYNTFTRAITEKYCDLYWQDSLLINMYETVNNKKLPLSTGDYERSIKNSYHKLSSTPHPNKPLREKHTLDVHSQSSREDTSSPTPDGQYDIKPIKISDPAQSLSFPLAESSESSTDTESHLVSGWRTLPKPKTRKLIERNSSNELSISKLKLDRRLSDASSIKYDSDTYTSGVSLKTAPDDRNQYSENRVKGISQNLLQVNSGSLGAGLRESDDFSPVQSESKYVDQLDRHKRSAVIYYPAEMELYLRVSKSEISHQMNSKTKEAIEQKIVELDQQIMIEIKMKSKTANLIDKLLETSKSNKVDNRGKISKLSLQLQEMIDKLVYLDAARKHLEILYTEQWSLDCNLLYTFATCPGNQPMLLSPFENPLLQFITVRSSEPGSPQQSKVVLQAGQPLGLLSYLFAQHSLSQGFIHQFLYCYRYFISTTELVNFLCERFVSAAISLDPNTGAAAKVKARFLDIIQALLEGYYCLDFLHNPTLTQQIYDFIKDKVIPVEPSASYIINILEEYKNGSRKTDIFYNELLNIHGDDQKLFISQTNRKWDSLKSAFKVSRSNLHQAVRKPSFGAFPYQHEKKPLEAGEANFATLSSKVVDNFALIDYSPVFIAQQLTLMEQELFSQCHPVHFLNSNAQGVGVALAMPTMNHAQSMSRLNMAMDENENKSLFVGCVTIDDTICKLIKNSHLITYWTSAEILSCKTSKMQIALISTFIQTAKICMEIRNFSTCISILDGLENVIVRQLSVWNNIPAKLMQIKNELVSLKVALKSDSNYFLDSAEKRAKHVATIPCVLLFLLHVQQLEIGSFTLANGMVKWTKLEKITRVIDQLRFFKRHQYTFETNAKFQSSVEQKVLQYSQQDLHVLASDQEISYSQKTNQPSSFLRKMKVRLGRRSDP